ncbi:MAG TPA: AI-2E family transporter [Bdellovibrio sp.]|nr:AI-2E family transporter [Bdellovibrio sp.]
MIEALRNKSSWIIAACLLLLLATFLYINVPFILPFVLAGIFALGLNDFVTRNSERWKIRRGVIIFFVILAGLIIFWAPLSLAIYRIVSIAKIPQGFSTARITTQLETLKNFAVDLMEKVSTTTGVDLTSPVRETLENLIQKVGEGFFYFSSSVIRSAPTLIFNGFLFVIFLTVLLVQAKHFKIFITKYSPLSEELTDSLVHVFKISCSVTLFSTFVIGVIQASIIGLGSLIFGEGDFWLVTPITFVLAFIPVIGAGPVGFTLSLLAFLGGRTGPAIGMLIFSLIASTIDNFLKPLLIGGKDLRISPLLGFTCVLGAILMLGLPGLLLGPVVMNVFIRTTPLLLSELNNKQRG